MSVLRCADVQVLVEAHGIVAGVQRLQAGEHMSAQGARTCDGKIKGDGTSVPSKRVCTWGYDASPKFVFYPDVSYIPFESSSSCVSCAMENAGIRKGFLIREIKRIDRVELQIPN